MRFHIIRIYLAISILGGLAPLSLWLLSAAENGPSFQPELILHNGKIITVDEKFSYAQAVAIAFGRFVAVGSNVEIKRLAGPSTKLIDLEGKTVVPGLADGHIHSYIERRGENEVDLTEVKTMAELLAAIEKKVKETPPGEVITTRGTWHEAQLKEQRLPTRWDLDPISPNHPVVVIRGGHEYILNSAALKKWNINKETRSPEGGQITFDRQRGDITGELIDRAKELVKLPAPPAMSFEEKLEALKREHAEYNRVGLTSIRNAGATIQELRLYQELARRGEMTVRASLMLRLDRRELADGLERTIQGWPVVPQFGDEWVRIDGIKLGVDGGYEGGWMTEPYAEPWGRGGTYYGLNTFPAEQYKPVVLALNRLNWRIGTHAVGDAAVDEVLDAYEAANRERPISDRRWTIEHAFITRPDQMERIKRLGVLISAQSHLYLAGSSLIKYWGKERAARVAPVKSWLAKGILVAGGTDNKLPYVPHAPLVTIHHWVNRDAVYVEGALGPEEQISRADALRLATINNAYLTFEEKIKGSIEPGKLADLVVLSEDIMTCPPERIKDIKVLMTIVGGRIVYRAE